MERVQKEWVHSSNREIKFQLSCEQTNTNIRWCETETEKATLNAVSNKETKNKII